MQKVIQFMEKDDKGTMFGDEKEIKFEDLDPNVALRMGIKANMVSYDRDETADGRDDQIKELE